MIHPFSLMPLQKRRLLIWSIHLYPPTCTHLHTIETEGTALGLTMNVSKSEIVSHSESAISPILSAFPGLEFTHADETVLLGSPLGNAAMHTCLEDQIRQLKLVGERLCHLYLHDAITILRHSFSIPKLLHTLRTSPAFSSPILNSWDHLMKSIVCRITNIDFDQSDTWLQATLPVKVGGLGFRSASTLAPSAFLASAEGASELMRQLLPASLSTVSYLEKDKAWSAWKQAAPEGMSAPPNPTRQAAWDRPIVHHIFDTILDRCADETSQSRLLGAATSESGAWLNAPPVSSLGLRMSNETVRIAMGLRIGAPLCLPHNCKCGEHVEATGHHGLSCRTSQGRIPRHQMLNTIIQRSLASTNICSRLEPSGLYRADGKRPDGVTLIPWSNGKFLVWDVTCVDTFCKSRVCASAKEAGGAASIAEKEKSRKYAHLDKSYLFQPIAVETNGSVGFESLQFLKQLGHRIRDATGEPSSYAYLLQRLSVAIQIGNAASVLGTLDKPDIDPFN